MSFNEEIKKESKQPTKQKLRKVGKLIYEIFRAALATLLVFYFSLIVSSNPVSVEESNKISKAIQLLEEKGFAREALLLNRVTLFRNTDNWLNKAVESENAFAATNCPFGIITIYPDFYNKTNDDTERAIILLHEAKHLQGADENEAYSYVWNNRHKLGWTTLSHGMTEAFITIELQTRQYAPEIFTCPDKVWNDCSETLFVRK